MKIISIGYIFNGNNKDTETVSLMDDEAIPPFVGQVVTLRGSNWRVANVNQIHHGAGAVPAYTAWLVPA